MDDVWYYSQNDKTHGPVPLAELINILSEVSQPKGILVWHPSFENWRPVERVSQLSRALLRPPPLPSNNRNLLDSSDVAEPSSAPAPLGSVSDPKLRGIGGWLILVALGQILGLLKLFVSLAQYYSAIDRSLFERFPIAFLGEAAMKAAFVGLSVYTASLFFRELRRFRQFFIYEVLATVFALPFNALWFALTISVSTGQSFEKLFVNAFEPREVGQAIAAAIWGGIWILYLFKSKRVANTFVN